MKDGKSGDGAGEEPMNAPLLEEYLSPPTTLQLNHHNEKRDDLPSRVWVESKKFWYIAGPSIVIRLSSNSILVITQAFAGHLGVLELAAVSISVTVVIGFTFGLLLGMASALETLCGQAYGAKRYHMLGIYLQRSWIVLTLCAILLLPVYIFTTPILKLLGQPHDLAELTGLVTIWLIPIPFALAIQLPSQRFLQCQRKTPIAAWVCMGALLFHIFLTWLVVYKLGFGVLGAAAASNVSWWIIALGPVAYMACGGCPETWTGFSMEAFSGLWDFFKLSVASGVMICLEYWYYRILVLMSGNLNNATVAVSALTICMSINGWEVMIPFAFFAATGVRVATELGAGNGKAAKFASQVSVITSLIIGIFFCTLIMVFHDKLAIIFTSSEAVLHAVDNLAFLLACTILLNSVQPILSGVAVGSGWQASVAYINIGCYYIIGLPLGAVLGWVFHFGVPGIWSGMIGGTAIQTLILSIIIIRCDWDMQAQKASRRMNMLSNSGGIP
ncbi:protein DETOXIFICATION 27-like [Papaver somniferum]|uniref:protein DETOXIFICATION 27-like n=1 Tax=Papaver somniferum TaxID=3469 RepID=UPI000E703D5B|nr:protein DETOXIFICATION 27-like [Papaver somniferum]